VNRLLAGAFGHLAPMTVAHPAEIAADITNHYADIGTLVLIAHSVHLCITVLAAQHTHVLNSSTNGAVLITLAGSAVHVPAHCSVYSRKIKPFLYKNDNISDNFLYILYSLSDDNSTTMRAGRAGRAIPTPLYHFGSPHVIRYAISLR